MPPPITTARHWLVLAAGGLGGRQTSLAARQSELDRVRWRCVASIDIAPDAAGLRVARVELAAALAPPPPRLQRGHRHHFSLVVPAGRMRSCSIVRAALVGDARRATCSRSGSAAERLAGDGVLDTTAFTIHLGAHRARPDAACVLHTQCPTRPRWP